MDDRFGFVKELKINTESDPETKVNIEIGQIRDLSEVIRITAIETKRELTKIRKSNPELIFKLDDLEQGILRLESLHKELTGLDLEKGFWEI